MLTKAQTRFESKLYALGRQGQLYIVPTLDGIKLLCLNLILLIVGLVYANNYVLLFNFILFCLFIGSMYYTHFNLQGLKLFTSKINPLHAQENGVLILQFKSHSALGHHFIGVSLKNDLIQTADENFHFSIKEHQNSFRAEVPVKSNKRGVTQLKRICVETRFPFHLFRAFTYFDLDLKMIVYPEKLSLDVHSETSLAEEKGGNDDDYYLKNFNPGDSLKRIHWKKYAQTGKLLSKQMISNEELPVVLGFSSEDLTAAEKEKELSSICFALHHLHSQNMNYGLALDKVAVEPGHSQTHLNNCLRALAEYET